jgi:adenylate cyclase 8
VIHWFLLMQVEEDEYEHVCALVDFALAMKTRLEDVNRHSFNNFYLRVGKLSCVLYIRMGVYVYGH